MKSKTAEKHKQESSDKINCAIITLSDSRSSKEDDESGKYIFDLIENDYTVKSWEIIPDEKENLTDEIEKLISDDVDVILTNGGTGLSPRDITVETVELL